ncbi:hypothetical protein CBL_21175, partial [Carabus blaptoides fortunei]
MFKKTDKEADAHCPIYNVTINLALKGKTALVQHLETDRHKKNVGNEDIAAAELKLCYHTVAHHLSFKSVDCTNKLISHIFHDSEIATKLTSARKNTEAIIKVPLS